MAAQGQSTQDEVQQRRATMTLETDDQPHTIDEADSGFGSYRSIRSQSITSSVIDYKYENGRRYHAYKAGHYYLPNDDDEQDRLDLQHHVFRLALDGQLFLAPLPKERTNDILDVGCGTGLWCIDVADELPQAQVLGIDLSPIQPQMIPPNCKFLVDDCNSDWLHPERFDLIHTRAMTPSINDWPKFLRQAYEHLKPGGYIELHEVQLPFYCLESAQDSTPLLIQWSRMLEEGGKKVRFDFGAPQKIGAWLQEAGFTEITIQWQYWPVGPWAKGAKNKSIGRWWAEDLQVGARNTGALFTRVLGWQLDEFEVFAAALADEIRGGKYHMWSEMFFAYARKPENG